MLEKYKPILTLIILSTFLTELITGSTLLTNFLSPQVLIILFITYGLSVLLFREIAVRLDLSYWGIYLLGFAYTIINEGLVAKTLIISQDIPIPQFSNYGYILGISVPWMIYISAWHAIASVLMPILITYLIFPNQKQQRWLSNRVFIIISAIIIIASAFAFYANDRAAGTLSKYFILIAIMAFWFLIAYKFGRNKINTAQTNPPSFRPFWWGLSVFIPTTIIIPMLAIQKIPIFIILTAFALEIWFYVWLLKKENRVWRIVLFGLGFYTQQALFNGLFLGTQKGLYILVATDAILLGFIIYFSIKIYRSFSKEIKPN